MFDPRRLNQSCTAKKEKTGFSTVINGQTGNSVTQESVSEASRKTINESELFSAAIKMSVDGIIIGDLYGYITDVNEAVVRMYGASDKSEFVGKHVIEFLRMEDRARAVQDSLDSIRLGQGRTSEYRALSKSGDEIPIEVTVAFISDEHGENIGFVDIVRDISNRKKTEEELRKNQRKMELMNEKLRVLGGLTRHDILNKLSIINTSLFLAKKNCADTQALATIENTSNQIRNILEFSRDFEILGTEELKYIDVYWSLSEALGLIFDLQGIKVVNDCSGLTVLADSLLRQVFYNLIDDTLKYGEKTTVIKLGYKKMDKQLRLVYEDDGVGIPADMKEKLFTRGFGKGTGLGLFLVKKIMEAYGWQVREAGTEGKGARFIITIPEKNADGRNSYQIEER